LLEEGILPAAHPKTGLSLSDCRKAYIEYLRKSPKQSESALALQEEKALESRERRRKLKRENDIADGKVITIEKAEDVLCEISRQAVSILEALPMNIKRRCPQLRGKDIEYIKLEIAKSRNLVADIHVE
jgi:phage terminase Nu1 subunit (DNA packaging protein)